MKDKDLEKILRSIDNRSYKAYHDIKGKFDFSFYTLFVDYVQGDPFAKPSRMRIRIDHETADFPQNLFNSKIRSKPFTDFLARSFFITCRKIAKGNRGSGNSGSIGIEKPMQEILERSSVIVNDSFIEVRFQFGLPAFGRRIAAKEAWEMFFHELPEIAEEALLFKNCNEERIRKHIEISEDADYLRNLLDENGLVSFVADDSILPRASGIDPRPLSRNEAVPFKSPETMRFSFSLPNRGEITGMGIKKGITLIVGGGYHGKSTLLNAVELGVYNHIPGDGREFVVTNEATMKIRAEDGRSITNVNISPFINNLPFGRDTVEFDSLNASGSTSQAANIVEALETGASALLIDEDTSATNFMIRDHRMQELVEKEKEPITPFIDKAAQLYEEEGVSTVLVIGGSGDYFSIADSVICMSDYLPMDRTEKAKAIAEKYRTERTHEGGSSFGSVSERIPIERSIDPARGRKAVSVSAKGLHTICFGKSTIDLSSIEQLVEIGQTKAIADAMIYMKKFLDGKTTLNQAIKKLFIDLEENGFDILDSIPSGEYSYFRPFEISAAVNRLRNVKMKRDGDAD